jgi:DNA-binding PadR family transcriptional regulator
MRHHKHGPGHHWGWGHRHKGGHGAWERGGPFNRPMGTRGRRMFEQGDLRLLLLALIADMPSHGYDLIRSIEARFAGAYAPSPGTIYPTLTLLEEQELIEPEENTGTKKSYRATAKGREHLADHAEEVRALMERIAVMAGAEETQTPPEPVVHAARNLRQIGCRLLCRELDALTQTTVEKR